MANVTDMNKVYLLLGCNLGNRTNSIASAIKMLTIKIGRVYAYSSLYESAAWGNQNQPNFLNQLVIYESSLSPSQILLHIFEIEACFDRIRIEKWGARTMDIDILFYANSIVNENNLTIPHPLLHCRKFALFPLNEISPKFIHPVLGKSISELCLICDDKLEVTKYNFD